MDTTGAVLGPLVAYAILLAFQGDNGNAYRTVFLIGAVPALVAVAILGIFIPEKPKEARPMQPPKVKWSTFSRQLKHFLLIVAVFSVGNSSDAFLIIRATNVGVEVENVLLIYALFNLVSAIFSLPAGIASDKVGRGPLLLSGFIVFIATYLGFAMASTPLVVWILFSVYGLYVGLTAGVLRAYAADVAPAELRGTAIGAYYTVEGISLLAASTIAGLLWTYISPSAPFYYGAVMALFASVLLLFLMPKKNH